MEDNVLNLTYLERLKVAAFAKEWQELSQQRVCATIGGAEYVRVLREWKQAGFPTIEAFIRRRANLDSWGEERQ